MPVVSRPGGEATWIDPDAEVDDLLELLRPAPEDALRLARSATPSTTCRKDGPRLLEPPMKLF